MPPCPPVLPCIEKNTGSPSSPLSSRATLGLLQGLFRFVPIAPGRCSPLPSGAVGSLHLFWASAGERGQLRLGPGCLQTIQPPLAASGEESVLFIREVALGWSSCGLVCPARLPAVWLHLSQQLLASPAPLPGGCGGSWPMSPRPGRCPQPWCCPAQPPLTQLPRQRPEQMAAASHDTRAGEGVAAFEGQGPNFGAFQPCPMLALSAVFPLSSSSPLLPQTSHSTLPATSSTGFWYLE